jgi:hypothetical protein
MTGAASAKVASSEARDHHAAVDLEDDIAGEDDAGDLPTEPSGGGHLTVHLPMY